MIIDLMCGSLSSVEMSLLISSLYNPRLRSRGGTDDDGVNACGYSIGRRSMSRIATDIWVTFERRSLVVASTQIYSES